MGRNALLLACVGTLAWKAASPQSKDFSAANSDGKSKLTMVVILSRHGVRSPTWAQSRLDSYSAQPWPKWSVPPGDLTSRGYEQVKHFGSFDRESLAQTGLVAAQGCEDASKTYIWADTDQRTIASGKALAGGLFPGCPPEIHGLAAGEDDPLFHPKPNSAKRAGAGASSSDLAKDANHRTDIQQRELLDEMQHVLLGCDPKITCTAARMPEFGLSHASNAVERGTAGKGADAESPLALASSFAEDFLLEYADGMPMDEVGWGKVDVAQLRRFLALHSDYFDLMHRTPALARLEASNMLFHIERTLEQGVERKPVDAAIGPPDSKLVILAGHDTNIAGVAALLGLHWTLDGRADDTPPGTQLVFELWQDEHGIDSVRISVAMQTLPQLREMRKLTPADPPSRKSLVLPRCHAGQGTCSWEDFRTVAEQAINKDAVIAARPN